MQAQRTIRSGWFGVAVVLALILSGGGLAPTAAAALQTFHVAPSGADSPTCGAPAAPCRSIQQAVNLAASGDTIRVARGTYTFNAAADVCTGNLSGLSAVVCFQNKELTILGGFTPDNWVRSDPVANPTIIDGQNTHRGIRLQKSALHAPPASLRLESFTVQNGLGQAGPAEADGKGFGGGLFAEHASLTLRNVIFKNNRALGRASANPGGGIGAGGGVAVNVNPAYALGALATLERVTFDGNQSQGGAGALRGGEAHGGGLFTYQAKFHGDYLVFTNNRATAADSTGSGRTPDGQTADGLGGAASIEISSDVHLHHVSASGNTAAGGNAPSGDAGSGWGGAFFVEAAAFDMEDADLRGNTAQGGNGVNPSVSASIGQGGGLASIGFHTANASIRLNRVAFIGNTARGGNGTTFSGAAGGGGAALTYSNGVHRLTNCIFADNLADVGTGTWVGGGGGGLWVQGGTADVVHSTFAGNRLGNRIISAGGQGAGMILVTPHPVVPTVANVSDSIIADHITTGGARAALQALPSTTVNMQGGLWSNNSKNHNAADGVGWAGTFNGLATWSSAPSAGFVAPGATFYNYHLRADSAAKNKATGSTTPDDFDGEARPFETVADYGADEHGPFRLAVGPRDGVLLLDWQATGRTLAGGVKRYEVVVTCPPGGQPPAEGRCGAAINAGLNTTFRLTGLTNLKPYGVTVTPRDASGAAVASSTASNVMPTNRLIFLPLTLRVQP